MNRYEIILATIKGGILEMIAKTKADDAAYYQQHEYHSSNYDKQIEALHAILDFIVTTEVNSVLETTKEEEA